MSPDVTESTIQLAEKIIDNLEEFWRNEKAFGLDFFISATEPIMQLGELLISLRLLPRPKLVKMIEEERDELFHWAHIGNGEKSSDAETNGDKYAVSIAKGRTRGFAMRLANVLREGLAAEKPAETEQNSQTNQHVKRKQGRPINPNRYKEAKEIMDYHNDGEKPWKEVATKFNITVASAQQKVRRYKDRQKNIKNIKNTSK